MGDAAPSLLPNLRPSCLVMAERVVQIAKLIKNHTHSSFLLQFTYQRLPIMRHGLIRRPSS